MRLLGVGVVFNHAGFRLMGKNALYTRSEYKEVNLFLCGIVPILGYKTGYMYYSRKERLACVTKYLLRKYRPSVIYIIAIWYKNSKF